MQTNILKTFATVSTPITERMTKKQRPYLAFNAAVKDAHNQTEFVKCQVFGNLSFAKKLAKGDRVMLTGETVERVNQETGEIITLVNVQFVRKVERRAKEAVAA